MYTHVTREQLLEARKQARPLAARGNGQTAEYRSLQRPIDQGVAVAHVKRETGLLHTELVWPSVRKVVLMNDMP